MTNTVDETINLLQELYRIKPFRQGGIARLRVYPDTEVYELLKNSGEIDDGYWLTDKSVPFYELEHSDDEIEQLRIKITLAYLKMRGKRSLYFKVVKDIFKNPVSTVKKFLNYFKKFTIVNM